MMTVTSVARPGHFAPVRIVMLPAAFTAPKDFVQAGFIAAARARELNVDLVFTAPPLAHVADRAGLDWLERVVIRPARAAGSRVWLGGISLGGYLALCTALRCHAELEGLCLFAPYLGSHRIIGEVERAGGVRRWRDGRRAPSHAEETNEERRVWEFIGMLAEGALSVHVGLGEEDRFADRHRLLAASLAPGSVDTCPGGHDWPTWLKLWERFLDARFTAGVAR